MTEVATRAGHRGTVVVGVSDAELRHALADALSAAGWCVHTRSSARGVLRVVDRGADVVVLGERIRGMRVRLLCRELSQRDPEVPTVVVLTLATIDRAVEAVRAGAFDFAIWPVDAGLLVDRVERATEHRRTAEALSGLRRSVAEAPPIDGLIGTSPAVRRLHWLVSRMAETDATVLLTGETGTGKEVVARALHATGKRREGPFVAVDCAGIPESLFERELFGHVRGAFTDAREDQPGLLRLANGGTLFLDEVGELPLSMQPKLLRVLQERRARAVGASSEQPFDVRVIAATNRDLQAEVDAGRFRADLLFRLEVVRIDVPPLRERGHDVLLLASHFVEQFAAENGRRMLGFTPTAASRLVRYPWPGNVRELRNAMERAVLLATGDCIDVSDLAERVRVRTAESEEQELLSMEELERGHIERVLEACGGNKSEAARLLGLDRKTLYRKLDRLGVDRHTD